MDGNKLASAFQHNAGDSAVFAIGENIPRVLRQVLPNPVAIVLAELCDQEPLGGDAVSDFVFVAHGFSLMRGGGVQR